VDDCLNEPARPFPDIGMSEEGTEHHVRRHAAEFGCPPGIGIAKRCPCGRAYVFTCVTCGGAVVLAVADNQPACEHARQAWAELGVTS
jgi:hypothetical protein